MSATDNLARWHAVIEGGNKADALADILHDDAVFHSPVVHTPQRGKPIVMAYLGAAGQTLNNDSFRYVREMVDGNNILLEFVTELDGITINGVDIIHFNEDGLISDFKVMVRPLKAVNLLHAKMKAMLELMSAQ